MFVDPTGDRTYFLQLSSRMAKTIASEDCDTIINDKVSDEIHNSCCKYLLLLKQNFP